MSNLELAKRVLKVLNSEIENDSDYADLFKKEFNDFIWYPLYLASTWYNDLRDWCEAIISGTSEKEFFGDITDLCGIAELTHKVKVVKNEN